MNFNSKLVCALALSSMLSVGCGKKEDHKEGTPAVRPQPAKQVAGGNASMTFADAPSNDFYCRSITAEKVGEWTPCYSGMVSLPFGGAKAMVVEVSQGLNGPVVVHESFQNTEVIPAPIADNGANSHQTAEALYNQNTGAIPFGGNMEVQVPDGMRLARYSNSSGWHGASQLNAWALIADTPFLQTILKPTPCEALGGQGLQPNLRARQAYGQSSPTATPGLYCNYQATPALLKIWENHEMASDQIDIVGDEGNGRVQYIQAAMFQNGEEATLSRRKFTDLCQVPPQYARQYKGEFITQTGNLARPNQWRKGGTLPNQPVRQGFWPGEVAFADVHWCLVQMTIGMTPTYVYVSTWELPRRGMQTSDRVEFHYIATMDNMLEFEHNRDTLNLSLSYLKFRAPTNL